MLSKIRNFILAPASVAGIELIQDVPVDEVTSAEEPVKLILQLIVTIVYLFQLFIKKEQTTKK